MNYYYTFLLLCLSLISLHLATFTNNEYNRSAPKIIYKLQPLPESVWQADKKITGLKAGGWLLLDAEFFDVASLVKVGFEPIGFWPFR